MKTCLCSWSKAERRLCKVREATKAGRVEASFAEYLTEQFLRVDGAVEALKTTC